MSIVVTPPPFEKTKFDDLAGNWRTLWSPQFFTVADNVVAATYVVIEGVGTVGVSAASAPLAAAYLDPADDAIAGYTTQYRLKGQLFTNSVAPARTIRARLLELTAVAGGADANTGTFGAAIAGADTDVVNQAASTRGHFESAVFTIPSASWFAAAIQLLTGNITADAALNGSIGLQVRNIPA